MKTTLFIFVSLLIASVSKAQINGPNSPLSYTTSTIPGSSQNWTNISNVGASDDVYSTFGNIPDPKTSYTDYLVISNFGFTLPPGTTIHGIIVEVERSDPNGLTSDYSVRIVKDGVIGDDEKSTGIAYPTIDRTQSYGGPADLWGETWTYADIDTAKFGVAIAAQRNAPGGVTAGQIDNIVITVYYGFVTLPVTLVSFSAVKDNKTVLLDWKTADEMNMDHYEVERSSDGRNFSSLTNIACSNQANASYSFHDLSPLAGTSYYRLRMEGLSGNPKYSRIIPINFSKYTLISLSPSPAARGSVLNINNPLNQVLSVRFYSGIGQEIGKVTTKTGQVIMPVLSDTKGIIYYKVLDKDNQLKGTGSLLVY